MSSHKTARVERLLRGALRMWGVSATVEHAEGFMVRASSMTLRIVPDVPHGWLVFRGSELLGAHAGLQGLLRTLRQELAPQAAAGRLIVGSQSLT